MSLLRNRREKNIETFATLLGTYSLSEKERIITSSKRRLVDYALNSNNSSRHGQIEKLLTASSCDALRAMINPQDDSSSFPALVLKSYGDTPPMTTDFSSEEQMIALASFFVGRDLLLVPSRKNSQESTSPPINSIATSLPQRISKRSLETAFDNETSFEVAGIKRHRSRQSPSHQREAVPHKNQVIKPVEDIAKVPFRIMTNFSSSFALLIEARIRAYGNVLKRNIQVLSCHPNPTTALAARATKIRLDTLIAIAEHIEINGIVTSFHVAKTKNSLLQDTSSDDKEEKGALTLPIAFEAIVDIAIPSYFGGEKEDIGQWKREKVSFTMRTPGTITGCHEEGSHSILKKVNVKLSTSTLVSQMIHKACEVVRKAKTNADMAISKLSLQRRQRSQAIVNRISIKKPSTIPFSTKPHHPQYSPHLAKVTPDLHPAISPSLPCDFVLDDDVELSPPSTNTTDEKDCAAIIDYAIGDFLSDPCINSNNNNKHHIPMEYYENQ